MLGNEFDSNLFSWEEHPSLRMNLAQDFLQYFVILTF